MRIHNTKRLHNTNIFCARGTSTDGTPQGLKDNAFLLKGLCDQVSHMTAGYSGALRGSVLCDVSGVVAIVTALLQAVT